MYNFTQEQIFLIFSIIGFFIGILFDVFRVLRKSFKTPDFITIIQDIIFVIISGIIIICNIVKINNGEIRLYIFIAIFIGMLIYSLTISKICVIILYEFVKICKKILLFPTFCCKKILKRQNKKDFT